MNIEYTEDLNDEIYDLIGDGFNKYADEHDTECNYREFAFVAREGDELAGVVTCNTLYKEIRVHDLMIAEKHRRHRLGSAMLKAIEDHFEDKGFDNINLTTYAFQAPEFYKKCGYELEFVRKNKTDPKLDKYFFAKYF